MTWLMADVSWNRLQLPHDINEDKRFRKTDGQKALRGVYKFYRQWNESSSADVDVELYMFEFFSQVFVHLGLKSWASNFVC